MSDFGLTDKGFKRKRYIDILETMQSNAKGIFGKDVNVKTNSPLGMFFMVIAFALATIWTLAEKVYYSAFKDTAEGGSLDNVGQYIGIKRKAATYAAGIVTFAGVAGTVIPANFLVACGNVQFWTLTENIIGGTGSIDASIQAIEVGAKGNVAAGTINTIVSALYGVNAVTNDLDTDGGTETETATEFKARYDRSVATGGNSTTPSVEATILAITDVVDARVLENDTVATVDGIPPKCIAPYVYGGADADVAQAVFESKAGGIQSYGTTVIPITDSRGTVHSIGFTKATLVPVYVNVALTKDAGIYPIDGNATIKTAIIKYIGGADEDGSIYSGLGLEKDVVFTKIIGLCHSVSGVTDVVVTLSTDNVTFTEANVDIENYSVANTDYQKVVIA